jgi:hypothetical protein
MVVDLNLPANSAVFFPSKTLDYIAARKPILTVTAPGSTLHGIIDKTYGTCFAHKDISGIKGYIIEMANRFKLKDTIFEMPYQIERKFSAETNSRRLVELMDSLI